MKATRLTGRLKLTLFTLLLLPSIAGCEQERHPLASNAQPVLALPFTAAVPSAFLAGPSFSEQVTVTVTAEGLTIPSSAVTPTPVYRLEQSSTVAPSINTRRLLLTARIPNTIRTDGEERPCKLRPGVYGVIEPSTGTMVGILIVYPDCRMEVFTG